MYRRALFGLLVATTLSACGVHTRAAVRNDTDAPISVLLKSPLEQEPEQFDTVAPGTTSAFKKLDFDDYGEVEVSIGERKARVDLKPEHDNTVVVKPGSVEVNEEYNPENEWW